MKGERSTRIRFDDLWVMFSSGFQHINEYVTGKQLHNTIWVMPYCPMKYLFEVVINASRNHLGKYIIYVALLVSCVD